MLISAEGLSYRWLRNDGRAKGQADCRDIVLAGDGNNPGVLAGIGTEKLLGSAFEDKLAFLMQCIRELTQPYDNKLTRMCVLRVRLCFCWHWRIGLSMWQQICVQK